MRLLKIKSTEYRRILFSLKFLITLPLLFFFLHSLTIHAGEMRGVKSYESPPGGKESASNADVKRNKSGPDIYDLIYDDDSYLSTKNFLTEDNWEQEHNLFEAGDEDWALFHARENHFYSIQVTDQQQDCNAAISLFHHSDPENPLVYGDDWGAGGPDELISWLSGSTSGTMLVKISQSPDTPGLSGEHTSYTLSIVEEAASSAGLATIGKNSAVIGPEGGEIKANETEIDLYSKMKISVPKGALEENKLIILDDPGDIGPEPVPWYDYTRKWLEEHPTNATITGVFCESFTFQKPCTITIEFMDDGPEYEGFKVDDLPEGAKPEDMRIFGWNGSSWEPRQGEMTISGNTVSAPVVYQGGTFFAAAPYIEKKTSNQWIFY